MKTYRDPSLESLDLSPIVGFPIISQRLIPPHHPGQSNYIWEINTKNERLVVKSPRYLTPPDEDFSQGVLRLFEATGKYFNRADAIHRDLHEHGAIPVPHIKAVKQYRGRPFLVVQWMPGTSLSSFNLLSDDQLQRLGTHIARLHQHRHSHFGPFRSIHQTRAGQPLDQFWVRLWSTMDFLLNRYYSSDPHAHHWVAQVQTSVVVAPELLTTAPIMLDMDPSQFLVHSDTITALVDTEFYVWGPPELELVGLELLLNRPKAQVFRQGYEAVAPLPPLESYRNIFRLSLRLLSFQGAADWNTWMTLPAHWP